MQVLPPEYLVYVDVGGLGGLKYDFSLYPKVHKILFEPNPASVPTQANCQIMIEALGVAEHTGVLYITKSQGCCSLLKPNFPFLNSFSIKPAFEITDIEQVSVTRYKTLYNQGKVPLPDVLKIDVQGYEYQVLQGFEELLHNVVAIELGAHLHPIYEKQKLLHDIVELLHKFGFMCKSLAHVDHWDGHIVEFDAIFTKTPQALGLLGPYAGMKLDAVLRQWNLPPNQATFPPGWIF